MAYKVYTAEVRQFGTPGLLIVTAYEGASGILCAELFVIVGDRRPLPSVVFRRKGHCGRREGSVQIRSGFYVGRGPTSRQRSISRVCWIELIMIAFMQGRIILNLRSATGEYSHTRGLGDTGQLSIKFFLRPCVMI